MIALMRAAGLLARAIPAAALALGMVLAGSGAGAATHHPTARETIATSQVTIAAVAGTSGFVAVDEELSFSVQVSNQSAETLNMGALEVAVTDAPIASREVLDGWLAGTQRELPSKVVASGPSPHLPAGVTSPVLHLYAPDSKLSAPPGSVFGVRTSITLPSGDRFVDWGTLVYDPASTVTTNVTAILPITVPSTENPLLSSAELADYTTSQGLLTRLLDGVMSHPQVTLAVDPRIAASIRVLGTTAPASATEWLDRLLELDNPMLSLAFADSDLAAQAQLGDKLLDVLPLSFGADTANFAKPASEPSTPPQVDTDGLPTNDELLALPAVADIAWPPSEVISDDDLAVYAKSGLPTTLISSASLPGYRPGTSRYNTAVGDVLVIDQAASDALDSAAKAVTDTAWSQSIAKLTAYLAVTATANPDSQLLLALSRTSWPVNASRLDTTLHALDQSLWTTPQTLALLRVQPAAAAIPVTANVEPAARASTVKQLSQSADTVAKFANVLEQPELLRGKTRAQLLNLLSVAWRSEGGSWYTAAETLLDQNASTLSAVRILSNGDTTYNLLAGQASIPVTVDNSLPYPAAVTLSVRASDSRLVIGDVPVTTLQANTQSVILVPVRAQLGNGQANLSLQLTTSAGTPVGPIAQVEVNVNADWEGIGVAILGVALAGLFGFGLVRNILKRRRGITPKNSTAVAAVAARGKDKDKSKDEGKAADTGPVESEKAHGE